MNYYPPSKTKPWNHQINALNKAINMPHFYYAHDMGCGKTKLAIDDINHHKSKLVLIVCPQKVMPVWKTQFQQHSAHPYNVLLLNDKRTTATGKALEMRDFIKWGQKSNQRIAIVINYELIIRFPLGNLMKPKNKYKIAELGEIFKHIWDQVVCDEAHRLKSPGGKMMNMMFRLRPKIKRILMLSGTPMPHSPIDIYAQMKIMNPGIFGTSKKRFQARYCILGGYNNQQVFEWVNLDDLHKKFFNWADYVHADDALDLPERMDVTIPCDLEPRTMKIYHELEQEFIAEVADGVITVNNALEKLLRLQQITAGLVRLDDGHDEKGRRQYNDKIIDNNKVETIFELVDGIDLKEPIVIFYLFVNEGHRIKKLIETKTKRIVAEISGHKDEQDLFESGQASVALVQIQSGSEGLDNLKRARYCIYGCTGFSLGRYRQSRRRVWRPGQTRKVIYYNVVANNTVDIKVVQSHKKRAEVVNYVLSEIKKDFGSKQPANPAADMKKFAMRT